MYQNVRFRPEIIFVGPIEILENVDFSSGLPKMSFSERRWKREENERISGRDQLDALPTVRAPAAQSMILFTFSTPKCVPKSIFPALRGICFLGPWDFCVKRRRGNPYFPIFWDPSALTHVVCPEIKIITGGPASQPGSPDEKSTFFENLDRANGDDSRSKSHILIHKSTPKCHFGVDLCIRM